MTQCSHSVSGFSQLRTLGSPKAPFTTQHLGFPAGGDECGREGAGELMLTAEQEAKKQPLQHRNETR